MKIKYIEIKNFKVFKNTKIDFTSNKNEAEKEIELDFVSLTKDNNHVIPYLNYIIGRNSIGKTTIIDVIKFVAKFVINEQEKKVKRKLFLQKKLEFRRKQRNQKKYKSLFELTRELEKEIDKKIDDGKYDETINKETMKVYIDEYLKFAKNTKKPIEIRICFDQEKDFLIELIYPSYSTIENPDFIYKPNFTIKNKTNELIKKFQNWAQNTLNFTKMKNLFYFRESKYELDEMLSTLIEEFSKNKKSLIDLNKLIKLADPQFIEFIWHFESLRYARKGKLTNLDVETLSSGTKKFIKLLYWILKFAKAKSGILMIDEIENHLHKELINVVKIGLMEITTKYDLQVILTTHNPLILKEFVVNKQVISLDDSENENDKIIASKVSSKIKPKNNIIKKYEYNIISVFPSPQHAKIISKDIFKKW